ncbi:MAG TPA: branched-chain amino acid ABC transporter permease [Candidatus Binatia bacterium]|nr:branched-chain amino acid ABC transporter permease [Candidatus Binatia bacterium]
MKLTALGILLAAAFAALPFLTARIDLLNLGVQIFLAVVLAQSWNLLGGYAGQINLGHAAFFGLGALVTRTLWVGGAPVLAALVAGASVAAAFGCLIGVPAFRLRGAYFAIGTLGLAEILRITVGNLLPEISTLSAGELASYSILPRYYLTLALAVVCVTVVALLVPSPVGLGMRAVREDEAAAEASGVSAMQHKLLALALSTSLSGLAGGAFAYYHVSYYPQHTFSPAWTFDAVLMSFIGGVGTVHGPVLGALFYVILKEVLALRWVKFHLIIFGVLFMLVVLFLPGGLVEAGQRGRRLFSRAPGDRLAHDKGDLRR